MRISVAGPWNSQYVISPMKRVVRTSKRNKLDPRYVGPFEILEKIGLVA